MAAIAERFTVDMGKLPVADRNNAPTSITPEELDWDSMVNEIIELYNLALNRNKLCVTQADDFASFTPLPCGFLAQPLTTAFADGSVRRPVQLRERALMHDVGEYWHNDWKGQVWNLIWLYFRQRFTNNFIAASRADGWIDFLSADCEINRAVLSATHEAMLQGFAEKWVHLRLRPRQLTTIIQNESPEYVFSAPYAADFRAKAEEFYRRNGGSYALTHQYNDGYPQHPAFPSGHAIVVAVAVTMARGYFKFGSNQEWAELQLSNIVNSVNFGRMIGGIHYRSDMIAGNKIGEAHAFEFLDEIGLPRPTSWFGN